MGQTTINLSYWNNNPSVTTWQLPFHGSLPKSKAVPEREGGKPKVWRKGFKAFSSGRRCWAKRNGLNLIFSRWKVGFTGTFLSKKFPAPSKISLRPHIPCACGNRLCNVYGNRYMIYVLKSTQKRFYQTKFEKIKILIT